MAMDNLYLPLLTTIEDVYEETPDTRSYKLIFKDPKVRDTFDFKTGQFGIYSAFGGGESTFCIASSPTRKGYIQCTFRNVGRVTSALADLTIGDTVGFRGPLRQLVPHRGVGRKEPHLHRRGDRPPAGPLRYLELSRPEGAV